MKFREINQRCADLVRYWSRRNAVMKKWYDTIMLKNVLQEKYMESFISNDPRTFFNMALSLLNPERGIPHKIPTEGLQTHEITATSGLERLVENAWQRLGGINRRRGRATPITELVQLLLCTGWYSVFAMAEKDRLVAEVWNPAQVYPNWTDEGLVECAHVFNVTGAEANRICDLNEWRKPSAGYKGDRNLFRDYWKYENGKVFNAVTIGTMIAKRYIETDFPHIPIFIAPVGGLPDRGVITGSDIWKEQVGEAIVATNLAVYENYNKQLTFLQQVMRDAATPRWFEQTSQGEDRILREEDMFKRGAIFRGGLEDKVGPLQSPPIPVEVQSMLYNVQAMLNKGSIPPQLYGSLQETVSAYMLTQVSAAGRKILRAYHDGIIDVLTDIDNFWISQVLEHNYRPWDFEVPQNLPVDHYMTAAYTIQIPGDLVLRATVARMVCADFKLSITTTMDLLFPEIENPQAELNKVIADMTSTHPVAVSVEMVKSYREMARRLGEAGDTEGAQLYAVAAQVAMQMLGAQTAAAPEGAGEAGGSSMPRGGLPALGETSVEGGS